MDKKTKELLVKWPGSQIPLRKDKFIREYRKYIKKITRILGIMKIT